MPSIIDNKRIVKNTGMLYLRTFVVLLVSLYTSRVILDTLGVKDYGIYQVVGGLVSMFSIVSGVFTLAISRYITFELGRENFQRLHLIFSSALIIQIVLSLLIIILVEIFGWWFISYKMTVPTEQITAVKWVLQFSVITFCLNLISIPYNACIIAHERMKAFAYISVLEVSLKLGACYLLLISPVDRLIAYAALLMFIAMFIRLIYSVYCHKHFEECRGRLKFDKSLIKEMSSFSSWNFIVNTAGILNTQGVTMIINVYFGLVVNAARGLAGQVEAAVMQFVSNFTMAINPQITKSYASGDMEGLYKLLCRSAKFAPMAMMIVGIPIILEMKPILKIWLGEVPDFTVIFARVALITGWVDCIGNSAYTACMATGKIKKYSLIVTPIGYINFIAIWIAFTLGLSVVWAYWLYLINKILINIVRIFLLQKLINLHIWRFLNNVYVPIILVGISALVIPIFLINVLPESIIRIVIVSLVSLLSVSLSVYYIGLNQIERLYIKNVLMEKIKRI